MKQNSLFISDLHLCASRPEITNAFKNFLFKYAIQSEYLFILGDLFDYWIGDEDIIDPLASEIIANLKEVSDGGTAVFLTHGNRDFLLGNKFANAAGLKLLGEKSEFDLYGEKYLLMHGDTLCTDDHNYLAFRNIVRSGEWQKTFLKQSTDERRNFAQSMRANSKINNATKSIEIMDVNGGEVKNIFKKHSYRKLIHGHTHRPAHHSYRVDGIPCDRYVLPDWDDGGGYIMCDVSGCQLVFL